MRRLFACALIIVFAALVARAEERTYDPAQILYGAIAEAKLCKYTILKTALDDDGNPKGPRAVEDKEGQNVLDKLTSGDKNYLRALNKLQGSTSLDPENGTRRIDVSLAEELHYPWKIVITIKLQKLKVVLDQKLQEDKWQPTNFELTIKYWVGRRWGITVHEKYEAEAHCD